MILELTSTVLFPVCVSDIFNLNVDTSSSRFGVTEAEGESWPTSLLGDGAAMSHWCTLLKGFGMGVLFSTVLIYVCQSHFCVIDFCFISTLLTRKREEK